MITDSDASTPSKRTSRRRKTAHLKAVPPTLEHREAIKRRCDEVTAKLDKSVPMTKDEIPNSEPAQKMIRDSASGRIGRPEEVAAVSVFLCSPEASFAVATDWLVDGGHTAAMGF